MILESLEPKDRYERIDKWIDETDVMANPFGYPHENKDWEWRYIDV